MKTEGDGVMRIINLLRGPDRLETTLNTAEVTKINPLSIRLPGYRDDIPEEALVVAEELKDYERTWRLKGSLDFQTYEIKSSLEVGDRVIVAIVDDGQTIYVLSKEAK